MSAVWAMLLPPTEKLVLLRLADHADELGAHAYPSVGTLAEAACVSTRTVQRILQGLRQQRLIVIEQPATRYKPTTYQLTLPASAFSPLKRNMARGAILSSLDSLRGDTGVVSGVTQLCRPILPRSEEQIQEQPAPNHRPVQTVEKSGPAHRSEHPVASYRVLVKLAHAVVVRGLPDHKEIQQLAKSVEANSMRFTHVPALVAALDAARSAQQRRERKRA